MKSNAIFHLIITTMCFISLNGCATIEKNLGVTANRSVENNLFSSSFPEMKLQISRDFKYLGSVKLIEPAEERLSFHANPGENLEATSYLFGQTDRGNRMTNGVLIRMLVMHGDPSQSVPPEIFTRKGRRILDSGEMKILEERYQYDLYAEPEPFKPKEKGLLGSSRVPSCFLVKELSSKAGFGNKSRVQILYFEDLSETCANRPCGACPEPAGSTAEQKRFLQGFTDRSFASIRFLKTRSVEDTTSRYVDAEPKVQPAPAGPAVLPAPVERVRPVPPPERAQPAPVERMQPAPVVAPAAPAAKAPPAPIADPARLDNLEKRLEALKRIYEKKLISKEDYEKKKAEILEGL